MVKLGAELRVIGTLGMNKKAVYYLIEEQYILEIQKMRIKS